MSRSNGLRDAGLIRCRWTVSQRRVEFLPILPQGLWLTILVTIGSLLLSTVLGLVWALMRVSGIGVLAGLSAGLST